MTTGRYDEVYARSLREPEDFWAEAAGRIDWFAPWQRVLDAERAPFYRWFPGGRVNTCHNAPDRWVDGGRADQPALMDTLEQRGCQLLLRQHVPACRVDPEVGQPFARLDKVVGQVATAGLASGDQEAIGIGFVQQIIVALQGDERTHCDHR